MIRASLLVLHKRPSIDGRRAVCLAVHSKNRRCSMLGEFNTSLPRPNQISSSRKLPSCTGFGVLKFRLVA